MCLTNDLEVSEYLCLRSIIWSERRDNMHVRLIFVIPNLQTGVNHHSILGWQILSWKTCCNDFLKPSKHKEVQDVSKIKQQSQ